MSVKENYKNIMEKINEVCQKCGRDIESINVIGVTKYVSTETANRAIEAGVKHLGENRAEGLLDKCDAIIEGVSWHFIGTLQSRKVKDIIDKVEYIHSLDRKSLAKEIEKRATTKIKCFVQVNASGEESKQGLSVEEVIPFIKSIENYPNIEVVGLMTMAPLTDDQSVIRNTFSKVRLLQKDVQALQLPFAPCSELSMGMSNDFEIAIEEGATYIRIGTSLVGKEF